MFVRKLKSIILIGVFCVGCLFVMLTKVITETDKLILAPGNNNGLQDLTNVENIVITRKQKPETKPLSTTFIPYTPAINCNGVHDWKNRPTEYTGNYYNHCSKEGIRYQNASYVDKTIPNLEKIEAPSPLKAPALEKLKSNKIHIALEEIEEYAKAHIQENAYSKPKTILIATTWRSGSTFFAEAISYHPSVFYHYEPLTGFKDLLKEEELRDALLTIQSLANCDYNSLETYVKGAKTGNTNLLLFNSKIKRACEYMGDQCFTEEFLSTACSFFPIQLFKFVRIHNSALLPIIEGNLNAHLIFLVRDPRAIFASRLKLKWCMEQPDCGNPETFCSGVTADLMSFNVLQHEYPDQVHMVKFEDLAVNSTVVLKELLGQLGMDWSEAIDKYLGEHTNADLDEPWSTYRISRFRTNHWKPHISADMIGFLQDKCDEFMSELNYTKIDVSLCEEFC